MLMHKVELQFFISEKLGKIVCLDAGGRNDPFSDELLSSLDFISPNEVKFLEINKVKI